MISLQRSMHSSQMYTPGPAISFFTWRWLLPQKLQRSCSFPSVARAISLPFSSFSPARLGRFGQGLASIGHHRVDDAVIEGLVRVHEVVLFHVLANLVDLLAGVLGDDLLETLLQTERLARLDLDVRRPALETAGHLVDEDLRVRRRHPLSLRAGGEEQCAHRHRDSDADRSEEHTSELQSRGHLVCRLLLEK